MSGPTADLPYEFARPTAYEWTEKAYDLMVTDNLTVTLIVRDAMRTAIASGECPRCTHDVGFVMELVAPIPADVSGLGDESGPIDPEYVPIDVQCRCTGEHPGRPSNESKGCGILFRAEVLRAAR
ncbi:hypothetical protein [Nocardia sp. NPDC050175]|uniref:hypothetical protein n=1 Tax=Nocardia sp. NPDC050175 TaxID=3364317 RepID=UPI0037B31066